MKNKIIIVCVCMMLTTVLVACGKTVTQENTKENIATNPTSKGKIILATTTSTQDSGLLDILLPEFSKETGWEVDTVAVGTGEALKMGENGEADVLLVHAKQKEEAFIKAGYGLKRYDVMYNDFVVVGTAGDITKSEDAAATFQAIYDKQYTFVSRGDDSGTNTKELSIWSNLGINPTDNANYISAGQGMGATLLMAEEKKSYTLSDRATWLTMKEKTSMDMICEKDPLLLNYYGVIAVNPDNNTKINAEGAQAFIDWILSDETQKLIGDFGVEEYGEVLFIPNAVANK